MIQWEKRKAIITNEKGEVIFEQADVEVPSSWSRYRRAFSLAGFTRYHQPGTHAPDRHLDRGDGPEVAGLV